jgi:hypothetical protein
VPVLALDLDSEETAKAIKEENEKLCSFLRQHPRKLFAKGREKDM